MNITSIFAAFALLSSQAHADLAQALDPWGNRKNAAELRQRAGDLRSSATAAAGRYAELEKDRAERKRKLDQHKIAITDLKSGAQRTLRDDAYNLSQIVTKQTEQVEVARVMSVDAEEVSQTARYVSVNMAQIRDHAMAARVLAPLFRNSADNRAMWIAAIDKVSSKPEISASEFKALKKLGARLAQQETSWHWQRSSTLFEEFTVTIQSLQDEVTQKLVDNLSANALKLAAQAKTQLQLQSTLLEVLQKMKNDHDSMRNAFN